MGSDDSTGKNKISDAKVRHQSLIGVFIVGVCIGLIVSERAYLINGGHVLNPRHLTAKATSSDGAGGGASNLETASATSRVLATDDDEPYPFSKPARNDLEAKLREVAPDREVLSAVANKNTLRDGMLGTFCTGIKNSGVKNHLLLALDEETKAWADENGVNAYLFQLQFGILKQFVELGWSVLLSDVDIAIFQNPFDNLYRDHDVEGMTDGFDERTAYGSIEGFDDPSMGWARFAQYFKHFNLNSGLFWLKGNKKVTNLMTRLDDRLAKQQYWDQTAFNEEIFFLSHGDYVSPGVSVRVMDIDKFMNSKRLFKDIRHRPKAQQPPMPVTLHVNYHPDKHERMKAAIKYYVDGDQNALDAFPGGSEKGSK
eukprot:gene3487-13553_t